ncbi:MAG: phosphatidylglycerophosphatase A [Leptospirillia bacterium]
MTDQRHKTGGMARLMYVVAIGFGSGLLPRAPGTAGSVVGVIIAWPLMGLSLPVYLAATVAVSGLGIYAAGVAERQLGKKDPGAVVIDEIAGILVTFTLVTPTPAHLILGFCLFRLFDISKPPPCRWAEGRFSGGFGIMADDLMAGVYAALVLQAAIRFGGI